MDRKQLIQLGDKFDGVFRHLLKFYNSKFARVGRIFGFTSASPDDEG
jgi:hypothetical protein